MAKSRRTLIGDPFADARLKDVIARHVSSFVPPLVEELIRRWLLDPMLPMPGMLPLVLPDILRAWSPVGTTFFIPGQPIVVAPQGSLDRTGTYRFKMRVRASNVVVWTPPLLEPIPPLRPDLINLSAARHDAIRLADRLANPTTIHPYENPLGMFGFPDYNRIGRPAEHAESPRYIKPSEI
jgi:hypothetical protein